VLLGASERAIAITAPVSAANRITAANGSATVRLTPGCSRPYASAATISGNAPNSTAAAAITANACTATCAVPTTGGACPV
jgi:hypothetical protein